MAIRDLFHFQYFVFLIRNFLIWSFWCLKMFKLKFTLFKNETKINKYHKVGKNSLSVTGYIKPSWIKLFWLKLVIPVTKISLWFQNGTGICLLPANIPPVNNCFTHQLLCNITLADYLWFPSVITSTDPIVFQWLTILYLKRKWNIILFFFHFCHQTTSQIHDQAWIQDSNTYV